jgi:hypothetical protein
MDEFSAVTSLFKNADEGLKDRLEQYDSSVNWEYTPLGKVVGAIAAFVKRDQIEPMRIQLESEMSKYALSRSDNGSAARGEVKAYVSKNVGSFFAKAASDICTFDDVELFERSDHFHINAVENDETVRANNQAYLADVEGKPSLILRGFNPTAEWLAKMDPESYCEEIIRVGKEFAKDNDLSGGVYITTQDEGWHALSNREQVSRYLTARYINGKAGVAHELQVASNHSINKIYRV